MEERAPASSGGVAAGSCAAGLPEFLEVYEAHFDFVWRCLAMLGVGEDNLEDAAQDVMLVVHRRLESFEGRSSLRTWVFGITHNIAANYRRRRRRKGHCEPLPNLLPDPGASPDQTAVEREDLRFVQRFMDGLEATDCTIFLSYFVESMSAKEVAEVLGCSPREVYTRSRALRRRFQIAQRDRGGIVTGGVDE